MTDRELKIALGHSRTSKFWSNKTLTFRELCERLQTPVRTPETVSEYARLPKKDRDLIKDKGGFVMAHLRENRRLSGNVVCRSALVYDCDNPGADFPDRLEDFIPFTAVAYSTHSHTPEAPRLRVIVPVTRDLTPDEHNAVSRLFAANLGFIAMTDPCSFEPHQLMYWPTVPSDGEYFFKVLSGDILSPDDVLSACPGWRDCSLLPTTPRESAVRPRTDAKQSDPTAKKGPVGLFCRAFTVPDAIEKFLPDVYAPCDGGRYTYLAGESTGGLVTYENGAFAYSFHATDPAFGKLSNAFDLVRLHRFPSDDDKDSYAAMSAFVMSLPEIKVLAAKEHAEEVRRGFEEAEAPPADSDAWLSELEYDSRGNLKNTLQNLLLILNNDPALKGIGFNRLADSMEITSPVPWDPPAKFWRDADDAQLTAYIDKKYGNFSQRNYTTAVTKAADDRSYHPIRQYLESLPPWDGIPRAETYFIDCLGAEDNPYVRAVTRKLLLAACRRVYHPGAKFDVCVVISGSQGIGKSTAISRLGMEWYSDSLTLSDMSDKTAAEKLQGYWIMEIGELAGMRKADMEKVKAFISRVDDKYRAAFGRRVTSHPRQCVMIGTTNADGYLRDITGNRRFWIIKARGGAKIRPWDIGRDTIAQIWAEVKTFPEDEKLYLPDDLREYAEKAQAEAMEPDERVGLVTEYLNTLLPESWDDMDFQDRRSYFLDPDNPLRPKGVRRRDTVSNIEIWCECLGRPREDLRSADSFALASIMVQVEGWTRTDERIHTKYYGHQRIYRRQFAPAVTDARP